MDPKALQNQLLQVAEVFSIRFNVYSNTLKSSR